MKKKKGESSKETFIVFSAHSDDFVLGAGGTIAKSVQEGKNVLAIVFSYGEKSHPWMKEEIIQKVRSQETLESCRFLHCRAIFFDLRELHFLEDYQQKDVKRKLLKLLEKEKPSKIFTHSNEDPHPDHRAVHNISISLVDDLNERLKRKPELYIYSVWNPVSLKTEYPSLYVDITKTFMAKMRALRAFRSQKIHIAYPLFLCLFRAIWEGFKIRARFAEKFFRIR